MDEREYTLAELSEASGVPARTIRFYIQKHVLPGPSGKGPKSRYDASHFETLQTIRRCQDAGMSLEIIREELDRRRELAELGAEWEREAVSFDMAAPLPFGSGSAQEGEMYPVDSGRLGHEDGTPWSVRRSTWERIILTPAIELHVRRPLPVSQRRALEELLEVAERLFAD